MAADADEEAEDTLAPQGQQMQVSPPQSPMVPTPPQSPMVPTPSQSALVQTPSQSPTVPTPSHQGCCRQHRPTPTHVSQYDAFLSHDWGTDTHGRPNHDRVKTICEGLEERGLRVWFDANNMSDDVQRDMVEGIQNSKCLVAFVTQNYIEKVGSKGFDNCKGEFDYARTIEKPMIAVPMETCMQNTKKLAWPCWDVAWHKALSDVFCRWHRMRAARRSGAEDPEALGIAFAMSTRSWMSMGSELDRGQSSDGEWSFLLPPWLVCGELERTEYCTELVQFPHD